MTATVNDRDSASAHLTDERTVADLARWFAATGRVVPGLTVDVDGTARSWWWPLPAAGDRWRLIALLEQAEDPEGHRRAAGDLADAVDREVRARLARVPAARLLARRPGRKGAVEAWLHSLLVADPSLPSSIDGTRLRALADQLEAWVRSGVATAGRARLQLRVSEPSEEAPRARRRSAPADWRVELAVQDADEPSLVVAAEDLWAGRSPFGPDALDDVLAGLGRLARLAPEVAGLLDTAAPEVVELTTGDVVALVQQRSAVLADADIGLLLPSWWTNRGRVRLRARAGGKRRSNPANGAGVSGVGLESIVDFTWEAALGDRRLTTAELRRLHAAAEAKQELVRLRGEWVQVDADEVATLLAHVGTRAQATAAELLRTGLGLDGIDAPDGVDVHDLDVAGTGWLADLLDGALHATAEPIAAPAGFAGTLRPYQQRGVGWLVFLGRLGLGACLADDMGLGKTAQLIAALLVDPSEDPTLVVCPVSVLGNWERELARFAPELRVMVHHGPGRFRLHRDSLAERAAAHDVVLTTYSLVARDADELGEVRWSRLVLDEAQQVKNPGTAQARAVARLQPPRRVALTGTPVENRLGELWSLMHVLNPGLFGSAREFKERFAVPIEVDGDEEAAERLRRMTGPFVLRRVKSDKAVIADLPAKIETTERCVLTDEQVTLYQAVVDELLLAADEAEGIDRRGAVLAGILKLKQVCNHPAHFLGDATPLPGRSGKLTRLEELLDEIVEGGDKVLCFTQFREWGDMLAGHLARRYGTEPLWLHGGVRRPRREEMIEAFAAPDGAPLFLLSLKAGGTGLNLTAANHVIHFDRWWNPAVEDQATDRAHRIGQARTVQVHKLVATGTIEERIDEMIARKRALADKIVGAGEQWVTELSTDELRDVLALRVAGGV